MITLFLYQGSALTGGSPGDIVSLHGLSWTVTEQGHLLIVVPADNATALDLIDRGVASIQEG